MIVPKNTPRRGGSGTAASAWNKRFLLWVDGVGCYHVCLGCRVSIGQPAGWPVDVPIVADLSRLHAWIVRDGEGYVLRALGPATVNGRQVATRTCLAHGDGVLLGRSVRIRWEQPTPLSGTVRLTLESNHRLSTGASTVLLMADTCIAGPEPSAHIVARRWTQQLVLYREADSLWCRTSGDFEADGRLYRDRARIHLGSRIRAELFSVALEPLRS
jgi:hypothetical protein